MNTAEGFTSTPDLAPDDGEPPSLGNNRSWQSAWQVDPFTVDKEYVRGVEHLQLLAEQTDEDRRTDREALAVTALRNVQIEREYFEPRPPEPKAVTGPQRIIQAMRKALNQGTKVA